MIGYKRPDQYDKDDPVFDVISGLLSSGRTSLLYRDMVRDKKLALEVETAGSFPGSRYPNLFLVFLVPNMGHTVAENEKEFNDVLEQFKTKPVDPVALAARQDHDPRRSDSQPGQQFATGGDAAGLLRGVMGTGASCSRQSTTSKR